MTPVSLDKLLESTKDGILLTVKVSPKSHRDSVKGIVELPHDRFGLAIRVCPPAADGAANEAVVDLLASFFRVSRSCVEIKSGATSRIKVVGIRGDRLALQRTLHGEGEGRDEAATVSDAKNRKRSSATIRRSNASGARLARGSRK